MLRYLTRIVASGRCVSGLHTLPSTYADLQMTCKNFTDKEIRPIAGTLDRMQVFPAEVIEKLGEMGMMAITASSESGGSDMDMLATAVIVEELSRGCASTGAIVSIHNILYVDFLETFGDKLHKECFLRPYTKGIPGAFALSEFDAGSDVINISTTARKEGANYAINGTKAWVTSAKEAEMAVVFATSDRSKGYKGLSAFLVPLSAQGVTVSKPEKKMGIRASSTCSINFEDVRIPEENLIGQPGEGFRMAMEQLTKARIGIASQALGIAQASFDLALQYASQRKAFGQNLIDIQAVQYRLARMCAKIEATRLLVWKAASMCKNGENFAKNSSIAKLTGGETANFCANECVQILGGMGYVEDWPAERHYRDARITEIYGGVSDIQLKVIADQIMKESGYKK